MPEYYSRELIKREAINTYGRMGMVRYIELVYCDDQRLKELNYRKKIHFKKCQFESERIKRALAYIPVGMVRAIKYAEFFTI